ncbi:hypothetical protein GCM10023225_15850 [Kineococcus glutinatus]|uniref:Uncharacterized protein n=1 Tax=Kineococcus glutinatus TaxID=1070872 RepID=A0ABP9HPY1_9ACTN
MLKEQLAPGVRHLGWKGSGAHFRHLASRDHHVRLNVQASSFSSPHELECTINVLIVTVSDWEAARAARSRHAPGCRPHRTGRRGRHPPA